MTQAAVALTVLALLGCLQRRRPADAAEIDVEHARAADAAFLLFETHE